MLEKPTPDGPHEGSNHDIREATGHLVVEAELLALETSADLQIQVRRLAPGQLRIHAQVPEIQRYALAAGVRAFDILADASRVGQLLRYVGRFSRACMPRHQGDRLVGICQKLREVAVFTLSANINSSPEFERREPTRMASRGCRYTRPLDAAC